MLDVGRICLKTAGREAGKYCVIIKKIDENFVMITGPKQLTKVKRRRCNVVHLEPLEERIKIKAEATDAEILKECTKANIFSKLKLEKIPVKKAEIPAAEKPKVEEKAGPKEGGLRAKFKFRRKPKPEVKTKKPEKPKAKIKKPEKPAKKPKTKPKTKKPAKKAAKGKRKR
jgi:large subunit ribosomal protein L14e